MTIIFVLLISSEFCISAG